MDAPLPHTLDPAPRLWQELADSCIEHDVVHERHVLAQIAGLVPAQRERDCAD